LIAFFGAPALCWWARMIVLSSRMYSNTRRVIKSHPTCIQVNVNHILLLCICLTSRRCARHMRIRAPLLPNDCHGNILN
jgi:hypothetical protein